MKIVLMVHGRGDHNFLTMVLKNAKIDLINIPIEVAQLDNPQVHIQAFNKIVGDQDNVDLVIVESNYGSPSIPMVNSDLIEETIKRFPNSKIIAYSSTGISLMLALEQFPSLYIMFKSNQLPADLTEQDKHALEKADRLYSIQRIKNEMTHVLSTTELTFNYDALRNVQVEDSNQVGCSQESKSVSQFRPFQ